MSISINGVVDLVANLTNIQRSLAALYDKIGSVAITTPPGGVNGNVQYNNAGAFGGLTDVTLTAKIQAFTAGLSGAAPLSGGGVVNFLRADGSWVPPATGGAAGGDLAGTYPNPTVAQVNGVAYSAAPAVGTLPLITGANTATYIASTGSGAPVRAVVPALFAGATGAGTFGPMGALSHQFSIAGVGNGADVTDDVLFTYSLPANSLEANGRSLEIEAFGDLANNGNNKTVKLWFGTTMVFSSGVVASANVGWWVRMILLRTGVNTQIGTAVGMIGATPIAVPLTIVGAETDSGAIVARVTGASPTTGAANDVVGHGFKVTYQN